MKVAALLVIAAIVVAVRWWTRRYDALGRPRAFPYLGVGLLVVLALGAGVPTYLRHHEEDKLSNVATQLVGAHSVVHCQTLGAEFVDAGAELGYVKWGPDGVPEHQTLIKHAQCGDLRAYMGSDKQHPSPDEVVAVHVLTHESMHMKGIKSESMAECAAVQRDAQTAMLLGADLDSALLLARTYWITDYPLMPDAYRSGDCAPGGALDEHLPNPPWREP